MTAARILVVEDDFVVARDLRNQLSRLGYTVAGSTPSGEAAVEMVRQGNIDLILADIRLEGRIDGTEAARQIRALVDVPVIFLTAYADDDTLERARRAEPYGYLLKPFEEIQLRSVVEMALYKHGIDRQLREAQAELARVANLNAMAELAASIAHEINQPLAAIVANAGAGMNWLHRAEPRLDEVENVLSHIHADATRAASVIRSLQSLARKAGPELAPVDLQNAVREAASLLRPELLRHRVRIELGPLAPASRVLADRVQLQQVLVNLLRNGLDALVESARPERWLAVYSEVMTPGELTVSVVDSADGIAPELLGRLFQPFFTTRSKGMGMGLAICRTIVEAHGGRIWAEAADGRGSQLRFTLPLAYTAEPGQGVVRLS